jgi:hypothetical protein
MRRSASLGVAIVVTWTIAIFGALFIAYVAAFPLALFADGNPVLTRAIGFGIGMLVLGAWALRTSWSLVRDDRADDDVFRAPWPRAARGAELRARGLLDRHGQPGPAALTAGDHVAELRGGERAQRAIVIAEHAELQVVVTGRGAVARILDSELEERVRAEDDGRPRRVVLEPGSYHSVIERTEPEDVRRATVHAWWLGASPPA